MSVSYDHRVVPLTSDTLEATCNQLGQDGWCLAGLHERDGQLLAVFARAGIFPPRPQPQRYG